MMRIFGYWTDSRNDRTWKSPGTPVNTTIAAVAVVGTTISHNYTLSLIQDNLTVTMDGAQIFSGGVTVPPVSYFYVASSTGGKFEQTIISNLSATVSAPNVFLRARVRTHAWWPDFDCHALGNESISRDSIRYFRNSVLDAKDTLACVACANGPSS